MPSGSRVSRAIRLRPMLKVQKELRSRPSLHSDSGFRPRRQNSIRPMPSMPYTPNRAAWPWAAVMFMPCM
ncbi:hypothetical protein FQZ97_1241170 [compost metagenome]